MTDDGSVMAATPVKPNERKAPEGDWVAAPAPFCVADAADVRKRYGLPCCAFARVLAVSERTLAGAAWPRPTACTGRSRR